MKAQSLPNLDFPVKIKGSMPQPTYLALWGRESHHAKKTLAFRPYIGDAMAPSLITLRRKKKKVAESSLQIVLFF